MEADADSEERLAVGDMGVDGGEVAGLGEGLETVPEMADAREDEFLDGAKC